MLSTEQPVPNPPNQSASNIAQAIAAFDELSSVLDNIFWEVSTTQQKDTVYNLIHLIHIELTELSKLSALDHSLSYEPITHQSSLLKPLLTNILSNIDEYAKRTKTAIALNNAVSTVNSLYQ